MADRVCGQRLDGVRARCGVRLAGRGVHPAVAADPAHPMDPKYPQREVAVVDVVLRRGNRGQMCVARGGEFISGRALDNARECDPSARQWVGVGGGRHDRDAGPRIDREVAAVFGHIRDAQHGCTVEQAVGDKGRPRIATRGQCRQRAVVGGGRNGARFLCGGWSGGARDVAQRRRDGRGVTRVAMVSGCHVGTIRQHSRLWPTASSQQAENPPINGSRCARIPSR